MQTGKPSGQADTFPALHATHGPARHAGSAVVGHAAVAPLPLSPLHPMQEPATVLQIGFDPTHALGFVAVHSTQLFVVASHAGF